jgi:hypothetical protein
MASAVLKKRMLIGVCVLSALAMLAEIVFARRFVKNDAMPIWQLELFLLPWVFFIGSYLSIVFTSWFEQESAPLARKALSTLGAAGITGLVTLVYFASMFH